MTWFLEPIVEPVGAGHKAAHGRNEARAMLDCWARRALFDEKIYILGCYQQLNHYRHPTIFA